MKLNSINKLPCDIKKIIIKFLYQIMYLKKKKLNEQFLSYILEDDDIGTIILYRIQGMPLLV